MQPRRVFVLRSSATFCSIAAQNISNFWLMAKFPHKTCSRTTYKIVNALEAIGDAAARAVADDNGRVSGWARKLRHGDVDGTALTVWALPW